MPMSAAKGADCTADAVSNRRISPSAGASAGTGAPLAPLFLTASAPSEGAGTINASRIGATRRLLAPTSPTDAVRG